MAKRYIKDKNGKFQGSVPDGSNTPSSLNLPKAAPKKESKSPAGKEWVISYVLEDGSRVRGIQTAMYGHSAIDFYAKDHNLKFTFASCETKEKFDMFLERGLREPLD